MFYIAWKIISLYTSLSIWHNSIVYVVFISLYFSMTAMCVCGRMHPLHFLLSYTMENKQLIARENAFDFV